MTPDDNTTKPDNTDGYPLYPPSDDIYNKSQVEPNVNPEDISKLKETTDEAADNSLDVPGAELDNAQENIGSEDEENNFYSLGGDAHSNLDEDKSS